MAFLNVWPLHESWTVSSLYSFQFPPSQIKKLCCVLSSSGCHAIVDGEFNEWIWQIWRTTPCYPCQFLYCKGGQCLFPSGLFFNSVIDTLLFRAKTLPVYSSPCLLAFVNISYGWQCRVWCLSSLSWLYVILLEIVQLEVVGDIANAMWQMKEILKNQPHWDFSFMMEVLLAQYL